MKKSNFIKVISIGLAAFFVSNVNVDALTVRPAEVEDDTYVIGNVVYSPNRKTMGSNELVFAGSKSTSPNLRIYWNDNGVWVDGITGDKIPDQEVRTIIAQNLNGIAYVDEKITSGTSDAAVAYAFRVTHKEILSKNVATITIEDQGILTAATGNLTTLNTNGTNNGIKTGALKEEDELLTALQNKIDLLTAIEAIKDGSATNANFVKYGVSSSIATGSFDTNYKALIGAACTTKGSVLTVKEIEDIYNLNVSINAFKTDVTKGTSGYQYKTDLAIKTAVQKLENEKAKYATVVEYLTDKLSAATREYNKLPESAQVKTTVIAKIILGEATLTEFQNAGFVDVTSQNLQAVNDAIETIEITSSASTETNKVAAVQAIIDVIIAFENFDKEYEVAKYLVSGDALDSANTAIGTKVSVIKTNTSSYYTENTYFDILKNTYNDKLTPMKSHLQYVLAELNKGNSLLLNDLTATTGLNLTAGATGVTATNLEQVVTALHATKTDWASSTNMMKVVDFINALNNFDAAINISTLRSQNSLSTLKSNIETPTSGKLAIYNDAFAGVNYANDEYNKVLAKYNILPTNVEEKIIAGNGTVEDFNAVAGISYVDAYNLEDMKTAIANAKNETDAQFTNAADIAATCNVVKAIHELEYELLTAELQTDGSVSTKLSTLTTPTTGLIDLYKTALSLATTTATQFDIKVTALTNQVTSLPASAAAQKDTIALANINANIGTEADYVELNLGSYVNEDNFNRINNDVKTIKGTITLELGELTAIVKTAKLVDDAETLIRANGATVETTATALSNAQDEILVLKGINSTTHYDSLLVELITLQSGLMTDAQKVALIDINAGKTTVAYTTYNALGGETTEAGDVAELNYLVAIGKSAKGRDLTVAEAVAIVNAKILLDTYMEDVKYSNRTDSATIKTNAETAINTFKTTFANTTFATTFDTKLSETNTYYNGLAFDDTVRTALVSDVRNETITNITSTQFKQLGISVSDTINTVTNLNKIVAGLIDKEGATDTKLQLENTTANLNVSEFDSYFNITATTQTLAKYNAMLDDVFAALGFEDTDFTV